MTYVLTRIIEAPLCLCVGSMPKDRLTVSLTLFCFRKLIQYCLISAGDCGTHGIKTTVQVRWGSLGNPIRVMKGTRQGGLSSTFLFNLVYKDMIRTLQSTVGGFTIDKQ